MQHRHQRTDLHRVRFAGKDDRQRVLGLLFAQGAAAAGARSDSRDAASQSSFRGGIVPDFGQLCGELFRCRLPLKQAAWPDRQRWCVGQCLPSPAGVTCLCGCGRRASGACVKQGFGLCGKSAHA